MAELRETSPRNMVIDFLIIGLLGVILAILGPFGTYNAPLALRLAYWVGLLVTGNLVYMATVHGLAALAGKLDLPDAMVWIGAALLGSIPMTGLVSVVNRAAFGVHPRTADDWLQFYFLVLVISFIITAVMWMLSWRRTHLASMKQGPSAAHDTVQQHPAAPHNPAPRLLDRLPPGKRGTVWALESEDHYVRVHLEGGTELILMRLRDAIMEMDGANGAQVHRSWWVARIGVSKTLREERGISLLLKSGVAAPVARSSIPDLEASGWLAD